MHLVYSLMKFESTSDRHVRTAGLWVGTDRLFMKPPHLHLARQLRLDGLTESLRFLLAGSIEVHVCVPVANEG